MTADPASLEGDPALLERITANPVSYWATVGLGAERVVAPGHVFYRMPIREGLYSRRAGVIHGGAVASLIDATAAGALVSLVGGDPDFGGQATLDLNVTYLNAGTGDLIAEGTVLRSSRTIVFTHVDVRLEDGTLVATGRATFSVFRRTS